MVAKIKRMNPAARPTIGERARNNLCARMKAIFATCSLYIDRSSNFASTKRCYSAKIKAAPPNKNGLVQLPATYIELIRHAFNLQLRHCYSSFIQGTYHKQLKDRDFSCIT